MSDLQREIEKIYFSKFVFNLNPDENIILSKFYGSTIRGGLGYSFKKVACLFKNKTSCLDCILSKECSYSILFESRLQNSSAILKAKDIPRPFIIELGNNHRKKIYHNNEVLPLELTLIGKAINYLPYFFLALQTLGDTGFGYQRKTFTIESILQKYPAEKEIYTSESNTLANPDTGTLKRVEYKPVNEITIKFITPVRIKHNGKLISVIEFHHLIKSLIHRITFLAEHWCDTKLEYDWNTLTKKSEFVKIEKCNTKWVEFERYSTRQKTTMKLGGIVGEVKYRGNINEFLPLLILGSYLHTGKNTTFGFGKYSIVNNKNGK